MDAVVLAGGLGTRLRERVPDVPKPMAPVAGRPFLAWLLDQLVDAGFHRAILSVGYLGDRIQSAFGPAYRSLDLVYAVDPSPLGTGGAIRNALAAADLSDTPIWIFNGDSIIRLDHARMWRAHQQRGTDPMKMTMAVSAAVDTGRYGALEIREGRVVRFNPAGSGRPGPINAGVYLLHRQIFDGWALPAAFSFEADFLARHVDRLKIAAFETDGWFIDIGLSADYERAQTELPAVLSCRAHS
jgi:D-glycero-alpha-D-manno-heptose 1-phosphate guanylyltransferase